jgi:hypothetical protein
MFRIRYGNSFRLICVIESEDYVKTFITNKNFSYLDNLEKSITFLLSGTLKKLCTNLAFAWKKACLCTFKASMTTYVTLMTMDEVGPLGKPASPFFSRYILCRLGWPNLYKHHYVCRDYSMFIPTGQKSWTFSQLLPTLWMGIFQNTL